ncbi:MAG: YaaR family protein [Firmicutes bacterium]|nr:YaaR family protein [Bacillota bacterium]
MKIRNVQNAQQSIFGPAGPETKELALEKSLMFRRTLSDLSAEHYQRYMINLVNKITEQGEKLAEKADIRELQRYRELICEFTREMVSNSYSFEKENSYEARRRHKVFATINRINAKLEELAQDIFSAEAGNLEILHKVDDIRGLILDIMM